MNALVKFFSSNPQTSAELEVALSTKISALTIVQERLSTVLGGIASMTDDEHIAVEAARAKLAREAERLTAGIAETEILIADAKSREEIEERIAAAERLRNRYNLARKAVTHRAAKLLDKYDGLADELAKVLEELIAIDREAAAVNAECASDPDTLPIPSIDKTHRQHPDREAKEVRKRVKCWVSNDPETGKEDVIRATIDAKGEAIPLAGGPVLRGGRWLNVFYRLEDREMVVEKIDFRDGTYLPSLSEIRLPPGLLTSNWHWPKPTK